MAKLSHFAHDGRLTRIALSQKLAISLSILSSKVPFPVFMPVKINQLVKVFLSLLCGRGEENRCSRRCIFYMLWGGATKNATNGLVSNLMLIDPEKNRPD